MTMPNKLEYLLQTPTARIGAVTFQDDIYTELELIVTVDRKEYVKSRVVYNSEMDILSVKIAINDGNEFINYTDTPSLMNMLNAWREVHEL